MEANVIKELIRKYIGGVRLTLTLIALILIVVAFYVSYAIRPLTTQETSLIGVIFGYLVVFTASDTVRKS
jgi:steroid 5-alpha reductase family enzyme